jgi:hypothetical protein
MSRCRKGYVVAGMSYTADALAAAGLCGHHTGCKTVQLALQAELLTGHVPYHPRFARYSLAREAAALGCLIVALIRQRSGRR